MPAQTYVDPLFEALINGDRPAARAVIEQARIQGYTPEQIVSELLWAAYEQVEKLHRADSLTNLAHHFATRLLRTLADQEAQRFSFKQAIGRTVFAICGPTDADELAGQMATDMLEAEGFSITYAGGGIATDEIIEQVHNTQPDALVLFASAPSDLPEIRHLIDQLGAIGAARKTQIVVGGGVFQRAEGLAEEIGADLWADNPLDLCESMLDEPERRAFPEQRTVGRNRRPAPRRAAA